MGKQCILGRLLQSRQYPVPTWHRMYLPRLEEALQSVSGCEDVMLPYWQGLGKVR
jgi:hypothetical protein